MKNYYLSVIALFVSFTLFSQVITTDEEYNYLTQGYPLSLESGQDFKDGYELKEFNSITIKDYSYNLSYFIHSETNKVKAILIIAKKIKSGKDKVQYLCLPINSDKLFLKYIEEKNKNITMGGILDE